MKFAQTSLITSSGQLSKAHMDYLQSLQDAINKQDPQAIAANTQVNDAVHTVQQEMKFTGIDLNPEAGSDREKQLAQTESGLRDRIIAAQQAKNGTPLSNDEVQNLATGYFADQVLKGGVAGKGGDGKQPPAQSRQDQSEGASTDNQPTQATNGVTSSSRGSAMNRLDAVMKIAGMNPNPEAGSKEAASMATIKEGLRKQIDDAEAKNGAPLTPEEEQNITMGYFADQVLKGGVSGKSGDGKQPQVGNTQPKNNHPHSTVPKDEAVRTPSDKEWAEIAEIAGPMLKMSQMTDPKKALLYGHSDADYEKRTHKKGQISDLQNRLGITVTGVYDTRTRNALDKALVAMLLPWAEDAEKKYGIPAWLSVGQAFLESSYGTSAPTDKVSHKQSYNLYGVTGDGPAGHVISPTKEQKQDSEDYYGIDGTFRAYDNYQQSVMDHARYLHDGNKTLRANNPNYDAMLKSNDPREWARGLKKAGYASENDYENRLFNAVQRAKKIISNLKSKAQ